MYRTINTTATMMCCRMLGSRVRNMAQGVRRHSSRLENDRC